MYRDHPVARMELSVIRYHSNTTPDFASLHPGDYPQDEK
jgi:hypothetical protein